MVRYPLRPWSPFHEMPGGRQEAGQVGMLRGSQTRRPSPEVAKPPGSKDAMLPDWGGRDLKTGFLRGHQTVAHGLSEIQGSQRSAAVNSPCVASSILPELLAGHPPVEVVGCGSPSGWSWLKVGRTADTRCQSAGSGGPPVADVVIKHRGRQAPVNGSHGPCCKRNLLTLGCHRNQTLLPTRRDAVGTCFGFGDADAGTGPKSTGLNSALPWCLASAGLRSKSSSCRIA